MGFLEIAEYMTKMKKTVAEGKKIDLLKIEPAVSPVLILGYDEATRLESKQIINHMSL